MAMKLDPEVAAVVESEPMRRFFEAFNISTRESIAALRTERRARAAELNAAVDRTGVTTEIYTIPGPEGAPDLELRLHRPVGVSGPLPCLFFVHGGGMIIGSSTQDDFMLLPWTRSFPCITTSIEYRLAPEDPAPASTEDCHAGLKWVGDNAKKLGIDPERLALGGASGGGGIAATTGLMARDRGTKFSFQFLMYPQLDDRHITPSACTDWVGWTREVNTAAWKAVLGDRFGTGAVTHYDSAARAKDLSGLPSTFIEVGSMEVFRDESIDYARRLLEVGVDTELHVYPGACHGFDLFAPNARVSRLAIETRTSALRRAWGIAG